MDILFSIYIGLALIISFTRLKLGIAIYLSYVILVPYISINILGLNVGWNAANLIMFIAFVYKFKMQNKQLIDWKPLLPFMTYFILTLLLIPFQNSVPLDYMLNMWMRDAMMVLILPLILWNVMKNDSSAIKLFRQTLIISILIAALYGLFLTTTNGINPYQLLTAQLFGQESLESYYDLGGGRMFGRISSVFRHPMSYAFFLGLSAVYVFYIRSKISKPIYAFFMIIILSNCIVCGVRSVLGGLAITIAYYFFICKDYKKMTSIIIMFALGWLIIEQIPDLGAYVGSIADINNKQGTVEGSSIEMRLNQLEGCLKEVKSNPVFGRGYKWDIYYRELHGDHPIILSFESLLFVVICNSGFMGFVIWGILVYQSMKYNMKFATDIVVANCLVVFYIAYSTITGEYGYMRYFLIFYTMILAESYSSLEKKNYSFNKR